MDDLLSPGGLRVTDTATGITLLPGCCNGLEERHDWLEVLDGDGRASFGHGPSPLAERLGDTVRLTVDAEKDDSPVIELPVAELRHLLAGAVRDLADFLGLAADWAAQHLPNHAASVTVALARALDLPRAGRTVEAVARRTSSDTQLAGGPHLDRPTSGQAARQVRGCTVLAHRHDQRLALSGCRSRLCSSRSSGRAA